MRKVVLLAIAAAVSGLICDGPASAEVFRFSFGSVLSDVFFNGRFTTGAASPTDPGYNLITDLDTFTGSRVMDPETGGNFLVHASSVPSFAPGAAFNETTGAFINHAGGVTTDNIGDFAAVSVFVGGRETVEVDGASFSQGSQLISGTAFFPDVFRFSIHEPLVITVPEPSTWAMMLLGFVGLGLLGYRSKTRRGHAATT